MYPHKRAALASHAVAHVLLRTVLLVKFKPICAAFVVVRARIFAAAKNARARGGSGESSCVEITAG